jgi:hypothetical protein
VSIDILTSGETRAQQREEISITVSTNTAGEKITSKITSITVSTMAGRPPSASDRAQRIRRSDAEIAGDRTRAECDRER